MRVANREENLQLDSDRASTPQKNYAALLIMAILIALLNFKDRFGYEEKIIIDEAQGIEERQLGTPVFSLRRAPELLTSPLAIQQFQEDLSQLVNLLPEASCLELSANGEEIYSFQGKTFR